MTLWVQIGVVALFATCCGALTWAWMRGKLGVAAVALFAVSLATWVLVLTLVASGSGDADGFATCDPSCTSVHYVTGLGFLAPPLLISLAAFGMLIARGARWRRRGR